MVLKEITEVFALLDSAHACGEELRDYLKSLQPQGEILVQTLTGQGGSTDTIKIVIPGACGQRRGGAAPTLGIIGRLGGLGARPERIGFVSDGDGALSVLAAAAKLLQMQQNGDYLAGDVIITTHICPHAPTAPHQPVPFMGSPIDMQQMNEAEVDQTADAILSVDTTKGNRICNHNGIAISPTVKEGYILKVSEDLLSLLEIVTGELPQAFALATQDITPYGNGLHHLNSILQPAVAAAAPVVGLAITTKTQVPGCATGATNPFAIDQAVRYIIEVAKAFTEGNCAFYDAAEFALLQERYGSMEHLQTLGPAPMKNT